MLMLSQVHINDKDYSNKYINHGSYAGEKNIKYDMKFCRDSCRSFSVNPSLLIVIRYKITFTRNMISNVKFKHIIGSKLVQNKFIIGTWVKKFLIFISVISSVTKS